MQEDVTISEVRIDACRKCQSRNIKKAGIRKNKSGNIQMFKCKDCNAKFSINLGFEGMRATPEQITISMNLYFNGESSRKVAQSLKLTGASVSYKTIQNWTKKYVGLMDKYLRQLTPQVGESWRTDELYLKIKGGGIASTSLPCWIPKQGSGSPRWCQNIRGTTTCPRCSRTPRNWPERSLPP